MDSRHQSYGCVRVERIDTLIRFVGATRPPAGPQPVRVDLAEPVPVQLTYLTVTLDGGTLRFLPDPYDRDSAPPTLAQTTKSEPAILFIKDGEGNIPGPDPGMVDGSPPDLIRGR